MCDVCCVYCIVYLIMKNFPTCVCFVTPFSSTFCISKKCSDFTFFSLTTALDRFSLSSSLLTLLCRDRIFDHLSINRLELARILSLPIFEGIHVERVPENFRVLSLSSSLLVSTPDLLFGIEQACEIIEHSALAMHQSLFSNVQCYSSAVHFPSSGSRVPSSTRR